MVNGFWLKIAFKSCIFAMFNAMFEMRLSGCFLLELRAAPVSRVELSVVYRTCPGASWPQVAWGCCLAFSREQECLSLWFGLKATVCLVSQSCPTVMFRGPCCWSSYQVQGRASCQQSSWLWGWHRFCNPLDWVNVPEHHQGSGCGPVLTMGRKLSPVSPSSAVLLNHWYYRVMLGLRSWSVIVLGNGSGRKFGHIPELLCRGMWAHLWEVIWWGLHQSQGSCSCQGRCGWH